MEIRQCEYMLAIAEEGSLARAADKLFLTQSALNQQLYKLEKELGAPLFTRYRNHWTPTPVGEVYLQSAREILRIQEETYNRISDLAEQWKRTITLGLTLERGMIMFTNVYADLHNRFPETVFQPVESTVEQQNLLIDAGQIDIGFQTISHRKYKHFEYRTILHEPFLLCIPRSHPLAQRGVPTSGEYPYISLSLFRDELFTLVRKTSTMREAVDELFVQAGFTPKLLFNSVGMRTMQKLASTGQCCCVLPRYYAVPDERVVYFQLGDSAQWELAAVYRKDHYLSRAANAIIETASQYWHEHPHSEG